ncbi:MAG: hypothetical protein KDI49_09905 [Gammaproteobacteria bacterium]|nr:hypothetical protein [Gammaproteobacteria bacterium]
MGTYLLAVGVILAVLGGWVAVQNLSRRFAAQHPEFGPYREKGGGCGACSGNCSSDSAASHCEK